MQNLINKKALDRFVMKPWEGDEFKEMIKELLEDFEYQLKIQGEDNSKILFRKPSALF